MSDFTPFPDSFTDSNKPEEPQASSAESFPTQEEMPTPSGFGAEQPSALPSIDQETVFTSGEVLPPMQSASIPPAPPISPPAKKSNKTIWIILAVVLILICVCCVIIVAAGLSSPDVQDLFNEFTMVKLLPAL